MERLTGRDEFGNADFIGVDSGDLQLNLTFEEFNKVTAALNKLAVYEDLEEQGLLVRLPCKPGETLYNPDLYCPHNPIYEYVFTGGVLLGVDCPQTEGSYCIPLSVIGKTVFHTQEEAENALKNVEKGETT